MTVTINHTPELPQPQKNIDLFIIGILVSKMGGRVTISKDELRELAQSDKGVHVSSDADGNFVVEIIKA